MLEVPDDQQLPGAEHLGNMKLNVFLCLSMRRFEYAINCLSILTLRQKGVNKLTVSTGTTFLYSTESNPISESDFLNVSH